MPVLCCALTLQVPNALLAEVKGTPGGCSAISISRDGRWLAAACGDDKGRFQVGVYDNSTLTALLKRLAQPQWPMRMMRHTLSCANDLLFIGWAQGLTVLVARQLQHCQPLLFVTDWSQLVCCLHVVLPVDAGCVVPGAHRAAVLGAGQPLRHGAQHKLGKE